MDMSRKAALGCTGERAPASPPRDTTGGGDDMDSDAVPGPQLLTNEAIPQEVPTYVGGEGGEGGGVGEGSVHCCCVQLCPALLLVETMWLIRRTNVET
jgi:hypothetical protein